MPRVYEIIMGMCLSIVNRPVKRLLVEGEWTEGGNWKWSQLFPFPQSVYGNAFGARFSSHGGGKDSGRESKTEREREDIKRKQRHRERSAVFIHFPWKRTCSLCVLHCVVLPLASCTKAFIYLS